MRDAISRCSVALAHFSALLTFAISLPASALLETPTASAALAALRAASTTNLELAGLLNAERSQITLVFVPGILGSSLDDDSGLGWGQADAKKIMSDMDEFMKGMSLAPDLIDESKPTRVRPRVIRSTAGLDLYGGALDAMNDAARHLGITFLDCGYDWRRDIRAGAADLERCIQERHGEVPRTLIMVAHSMGGLVTWTWAMKQATGQYSPQHKVVHVTLVGSPIDGSCEIMRMVHEGYVQPVANDRILLARGRKLRKVSERLWTILDSLKNGVTSLVTQDIRPLVLTWPGALELTPRRATERGRGDCADVRVDPRDATNKGIISYFDPQFWAHPVGKELVSPYTLPAQASDALAKAREFRDWFSPATLPAPTMLYYSEAWMVPSRLILMPGDTAIGSTGGRKWMDTEGDGRVAFSSALADSRDPPLFADSKGILSVHGNLVEDDDFRSDYLEKRLPRMIDAYLVARIAAIAKTSGQIHKAYIDSKATFVAASDVRAAFEGPVSRRTARVTQELMNAISTMNESLCAPPPGQCARTYDQTKTLSNIRLSIFMDRGMNAMRATKIMQMESAAKAIGDDAPKYAFAVGNKGLELAKGFNDEAAAISLRESIEHFDQISVPATSESQEKIDDFKRTVVANYGSVLHRLGRCQLAKPHLEQAKEYWEPARLALSQSCDDISGFQYCFDQDGYCPAAETAAR